MFDDPDHSIEELRFLIIGQSEDDKHLLVSHCYIDKDDDEIIRIIFARKATKQEKKLYEEGV